MKKNLLQYSFMIKSLSLVLLFIVSYHLSRSQVAVDYGKSYVNLTKGLNGGTIETGDTLQIRATFVVRCISGCPVFADSCAFYDTVKAGMTYIPGSLAVLTNEGKIYKSFTDSYNTPVNADDCGWINGLNIQINLGFNTAQSPATTFRRGRIRNDHKPSFFGSTAIMVASYRVRVTAALGALINTGGGAVSYKPTTSATPLFANFPTNNARVFTNYGICSNTVGTNALGTEFNGSFGSGKPRNRGTSANVPGTYIYAIFTAGSPNDYYYGIANNTSTQANYTTLNTWAKPDNTVPTHRVSSVWDVIGDHTGAVSPTLGNPAADTVANNNGGYMLVVNASYRIDSAFTHNVTGLCPNTYYELAAWFRNICSKCGCDSNGKGASNATGPPFYIPTDTVGTPDDSSGIYPNLTFRINGVDYYSTGNMKYTGRWVKKGFTYLTGPTQTSLTMTLQNNAPGGGGNDWAVDDISLATCTPNLALIPSGGVNVCYGNQVDMNTTVRCFFPNYIYWSWERSSNGGATWFNTGVSGIGTPAMVAGNWQYTANYPSFIADSSVHNNMFRIRVASTPANLIDPNCSFTASNTIVVWVNNCSEVLKTEMLAFDGQLNNGYAQLKWVTDNEQPGVTYEVQRSDDKTNYVTIGIVNGTAPQGFGDIYDFTDNLPVAGATYYRLKIVEGSLYKNSKIVLLNIKPNEFGIKSLINPFRNKISFDLITPSGGMITIFIVDSYGRTVKRIQENVQEGLNNVNVPGLENISQGTYILRVQMGEQIINKRVVKMNL